MGRKKDKKKRRESVDLDALERWSFAVQFRGVRHEAREPNEASLALLTAIDADVIAEKTVDNARLRQAVMGFLPDAAEADVCDASPSELLTMFVAVSAYYEVWQTRRCVAAAKAAARAAGLKGQKTEPGTRNPELGTRNRERQQTHQRGSASGLVPSSELRVPSSSPVPGSSSVTGGLELLAPYLRKKGSA